VRKQAPVLILALLALAVTLCAAPAGAAGSKSAPPSNVPLGVVLTSDRAIVSQVPAQPGTSLFDGDALSTDSKGSLRVRLGNSQLLLGANTAVHLHASPGQVHAVLQQGVLRFSVVGQPLTLQALAAIIRPEESSSGEVLIVGPQEFQIGSSKGNLDVDIDGDSRVVSEATAYDVTLVPADADASPQTAGAGRVKGVWILIALILLLTAVGLWLATESCSSASSSH
jgi:hypothetical protein